MARFGSLGTQYFDGSGNLLTSGKIHFYDSGTSNDKTTYADAELTIPNPNPVILTAAGRQPNVFFNGVARAVLLDSADVVIETRDSLGATTDGGLTNWTITDNFSINSVILGDDGRYYMSIVNDNQANDPPTSPDKWEPVQWLGTWVAAKTYVINDVVQSATDGYLYKSNTAGNLGIDPYVDTINWSPAVLTVDDSGFDINGFDMLGQLGTITPTEPDNAANKEYVDARAQARKMLQMVDIIDTDNASGTSVIPYDDTIPTSSEGWEVITGTFTPISAGSTLFIEFEGNISSSVATNCIASLFTGGAAAVAATAVATSAAGDIQGIAMRYSYAPGVETELTFSVRYGAENGAETTYKNGYTSRLFGGVSSLRLTIFEAAGPVGIYSFLSDPSTQPTGGVLSIDYDDADAYVATGHYNTPYLTIYSKSEDTYTKLSNPAVIPTGTVHGVSFSGDGIYLAVSGTDTGSEFLRVYKRTGGSFAVLPTIADQPAGASEDCSFTQDGTYLAVSASAAVPELIIYKRTGDIFAKLTFADGSGTGLCSACAFAPDGSYLFGQFSNTPYLRVFKRSGDTFTKIADPSSLPAGAGFSSLAVNSTATHLAIGIAASPYVEFFSLDRDTDTLLKLAAPAVPPTSALRSIDFAKDNSNVAIGVDTSPYLLIYNRDGDIYTKADDLDVPPTGKADAVAFSNTSIYLSAGIFAGSGRLKTYKKSEIV